MADMTIAQMAGTAQSTAAVDTAMALGTSVLTLDGDHVLVVDAEIDDPSVQVIDPYDGVLVRHWQVFLPLLCCVAQRGSRHPGYRWALRRPKDSSRAGRQRAD